MQLTEKQQRQFNLWSEENPHTMKLLRDAYIKLYVESEEDVESMLGFYADIISIEIAEYQVEYFLNTKETERKINEYTEKFVDELMYMDKPYNPNDPMV